MTGAKNGNTETETKILVSDRRNAKPPTTLAEAEEERTDLMHKLESLNLQLAGAEGRAPDWKKRTTMARMYTERQLRVINDWIAAKRRERTIEATGELKAKPDDPTSIIHACAIVFARMREDGVDFDDDEEAMIQVVNLYLHQEA